MSTEAIFNVHINVWFNGTLNFSMRLLCPNKTKPLVHPAVHLTPPFSLPLSLSMTLSSLSLFLSCVIFHCLILFISFVLFILFSFFLPCFPLFLFVHQYRFDSMQKKVWNLNFHESMVSFFFSFFLFPCIFCRLLE